ncbi:14413_t:CDS:2 [Funneliformis caledonium]|uniref:14413_t:CDS:1 n=1 Tax=Funneliformis caledonium TaxID=1117310 RepID=A0A9N9ELD9_9GLOM|nr:14413_t:CDS:2 [Funneliformis caledonium]
MEITHETPKIKQLRSYLNLQIRITASDGRIFNGIFMCIDKYKNIILSQTEEVRDDERRFVGLVMIPGKHIFKAEIEDLDSDIYT